MPQRYGNIKRPLNYARRGIEIWSFKKKEKKNRKMMYGHEPIAIDFLSIAVEKAPHLLIAEVSAFDHGVCGYIRLLAAVGGPCYLTAKRK